MALFLPNRESQTTRLAADYSQRPAGGSSDKGGTFMRRMVYLLTVALVYGSGGAAFPVAGYADEAMPRTVRGTVVATNVGVDPQTIVVNVSLPNKEELVVGARVTPDTKITRGKQAVRLADVKTGETTELSYLKTSDGLIARSIHVR